MIYDSRFILSRSLSQNHETEMLVLELYRVVIGEATGESLAMDEGHSHHHNIHIYNSIEIFLILLFVYFVNFETILLNDEAACFVVASFSFCANLSSNIRMMQS